MTRPTDISRNDPCLSLFVRLLLLRTNALVLYGNKIANTAVAIVSLALRCGAAERFGTLIPPRFTSLRCGY